MSVLTVAPTEIYESGDSALRVVAISQASEDNWLTVHRLADWLESCGAEGLHGAVPTYDSVLVEFDPILVSARQVRAFVKLGLLELGRVCKLPGSSMYPWSTAATSVRIWNSWRSTKAFLPGKSFGSTLKRPTPCAASALPQVRP